MQASDYVLHSMYNLLVPAHGKALVKTKCIVSAPPGFSPGVFAPGFAWVNGISMSGANTNLRGIIVVLFTHGDTPLEIKADLAKMDLCNQRSKPTIG